MASAFIFISHSSKDNANAQRVCDWLIGRDFESFFLDFDPERGIPAAASWERELYVRLRQADAIIFVNSPDSVQSRWCFAELAIARALGKPVVGILAVPGERHPLLDDTQVVDLVAEGDRAQVRLWEGLRRCLPDFPDGFAWDATRSAYPGLQPFQEDDAAVFFGRRTDVQRLVELLQARIPRPSPFVWVVGASGSGKSSLVRAGVVPRLRRARDRWVVVPPFCPERRPTRNLARVLTRAFERYGKERADVARRLEEDGPPALVELAEDLCDASGGEPGKAVLLVLDQAEELVTISGTEERRAFLDLVRGAIGDYSPLKVLGTLRSEFITASPDGVGIVEPADATPILWPVERSLLFEVIEGPARRAALEFEAGLVNRIVDDAMGGDALPLLAYTLRRLSEREGADGRITAADYEALGGVVGAVRTQAEAVAQGLRDRGLGKLVLPTLMRLATVDGTGEPTRRPLSRRSLSEQEDEVVTAFVDARLLSCHGNGGEVTIQVAHEALLRQWSPLRDAIEASRADLRLRSELERTASDWDRSGRDPYLLYRGPRLTAWHERDLHELSDVGRAFLEASREREEAERAAQRRRTRAVLTGLTVAVVVSSTLALLAVRAGRQAAYQRDLALSRQLAASARSQLGVEPELSLLLSVRAFERQPTEAAEDALRQSLAASRLRAALRERNGLLQSVALSPDGRVVATGGLGMVRLWDRQAGGGSTVLGSHDGIVWDVAFSPDGNRVASAGGDGVVRIWDRNGGSQPTELRGHRGPAVAVSFSPDGRFLASGGEDGAVRVWDAVEGTPASMLGGHEPGVAALAFSLDGTRMAAAGREGTVRLWNRAASGEPVVLGRHPSFATAVAFAADGALATAGGDGTIRLWPPGGGEPTLFAGHRDPVRSVAFTPDGLRLVSAGDDGTVRVWHRATSREVFVLNGHKGAAHDASVTSDGRTVVSVGKDGTVRVWALAEDLALAGHGATGLAAVVSADGDLVASGAADGTVRVAEVASGSGPVVLGRHEGAVRAVAFRPDGRQVATGGDDGTLRLWDRVRGGELKALTGAASRISAVAFDGEGGALVGGGADGAVRVWDLAGGKAVLLGEHQGAVLDAAFSRDGKRLVTAGADRTVRVWDRAGEQPSVVLRQPDRSRSFRSVAFSPDGRRVVSAGEDGQVLVWQWSSVKLLPVVLAGHQGEVWDAAFVGEEGRSVASAGADGTVRVWDPESRAEVALVRAAEKLGPAVFGADLVTLVSPEGDRVRLVRCEPCAPVERLLALARSRVTRELTSEERRTFVEQSRD